MKKTGFTLAEVLITLAIIGVVATLTLPALMTNTQEQQAKTALKKAINTLTEAAQMNQAIAGFDYSSVKDQSYATNDNGQSLYGIFSNRMSVDYDKTVKNNTFAKSAANDANVEVFLRDGSSIIFPETMVNTTGRGTEMMNDNLVYGLPIIYDTNGSKGPNYLSNCNGNAALNANGTIEDAHDIAACGKQNRVIKDQFGVRLRGGFAVPNGAAARWAFEN